MLNIDLEEAHLTAEAEAVISSKERHCVTAGITKSGSLGRSTPTVRGEVRQALHCRSTIEDWWLWCAVWIPVLVCRRTRRLERSIVSGAAATREQASAVVLVLAADCRSYNTRPWRRRLQSIPKVNEPQRGSRRRTHPRCGIDMAW